VSPLFLPITPFSPSLTLTLRQRSSAPCACGAYRASLFYGVRNCSLTTLDRADENRPVASSPFFATHDRKKGDTCAGLGTLNSRLVSRSIARWLVDRPTDRVGRDRETPGNACNYRAIGSEFANRPRASINQNNSTRSFATTVIIRCLSTLAGSYRFLRPGENGHFPPRACPTKLYFYIQRASFVLDDTFSHKSTFIPF
jgi:hypothetical protein